MTNQEILDIAMKQTMIDFNCTKDHLMTTGTTIIDTVLNDGVKKCYKKPLFFGLAYYGQGLVAIVDPSIRCFLEGFLEKHGGYRAFDSPQIIGINEELEKHDKSICFLAEFFLPDVNAEVEVNEDIDVKVLMKGDFEFLYEDDRFSNALTYDRKSGKDDEIVTIAYIDGEIAGVSGASNDCETMWQVGIDVIDKFRGQGVASTITYRITQEIIKLGKVPYYCTAWSNIASKRNALKCGYKPAWYEIAAMDKEFTRNMIK